MCVKIEKKKKSSFLICQTSFIYFFIIFFFTIVDASARPKTEYKINEMDVILHIRN